MADISGDEFCLSINDLPPAERETVEGMSDIDREQYLQLKTLLKQKEMAKNSGNLGVTFLSRYYIPPIAEMDRIKQLPDEALCEELLSAVKAMGEESLIRHAENLVDVVRGKNEKIMTLQATFERQTNELKELKSREGVRVGLQNMDLGPCSSSSSP